MENETFISCLSWIQRGFASKVPIEAHIDEQEIEEMRNNEMIAE